MHQNITGLLNKLDILTIYLQKCQMSKTKRLIFYAFPKHLLKKVMEKHNTAQALIGSAYCDEKSTKTFVYYF